jgi:DNA ligase-1
MKVNNSIITIGSILLLATGANLLYSHRFAMNAEMQSMNSDTKTLYKKTSSGSLRMWRIDLYENDGAYEYTTSDGQVGGKIKTSKPTVVNAGKASRSIYEQASGQVQSKINKKLDGGYLETEQEALDDIFISPMLAVDFKKRGHSMSFPAIGQRKFDGVRCIAYLSNGKVVLESRKGKAFPHLNHLRDAIEPYLEDGQILDGELYSDTLDFQRTVGLVRRESLSQEDIDVLPEVSYRIYDMFSTDSSITELSFTERHALASDLVSKIGSPLAIVKNYVIDLEEDIQPLHDQFVQEGYEGIMVRNPAMPYQMDKRSSGLMKFKSFKDDEFPIIGYSQGTGNDAGTVIWNCKVPNGITFNVRPKGTREERQKSFDNAEDFMGKLLTVRYFELTNDGVPRFPVGITIRDYE